MIDQENVSAAEVQNAQKVDGLLSKIDDITYEKTRPDIFVVTEHETGNDFSVIVDVEETTVCLLMEVMENSDNTENLGFYKKMAEINGLAVHAKIGLVGDKIVVRDTLEIENLDVNELEAALTDVFLTVVRNLEELVALATPEEACCAA